VSEKEENVTETVSGAAKADERGYRKTKRGYVVSDKMEKTITVQVEDRVKHALYGKVIRRNAKVRVIRDGAVVADNLDLLSLKREKDDASEVREGFECGLVLRNFQDIKEGDIVEAFEMREIPRA